MSKVIAVMNKPKNCQECVFSICAYSLPLSLNKKGYCCQLKETKGRVVEDFDYDADVHLSNCPLKELPKKKNGSFADNAYRIAAKTGYNACIDEILGKDV